MDLREVKVSEGVNVGRHPWEQARQEVVLDLLKRFYPAVFEGKRNILDIGCGDSWLIEQLSPHLPEATFFAIDTAFDDRMLAMYKNKLAGKPITVFRDLESALPAIPGPAHLVLLLDVIEHIEDDVAFLKNLLTYSDKITPDTVFLITVPAFQSLFCSHDEFLGHYRRYTNRTLVSHIRQAGLEPIRKGYFFTSLLGARAANVLKEKISKPAQNAKGIGGHEPGAMDEAIKKILLADYQAGKTLESIGIKLPGLSNYILCKKPA